MEVVVDIVFIVDASDKLDAKTSAAVSWWTAINSKIIQAKIFQIHDYILTYLKPYKYGPANVQAALVAYELDVTDPGHKTFFNEAKTLDEFNGLLSTRLPSQGTGNKRGINKYDLITIQNARSAIFLYCSALNFTLDEVFKPENGYRKDVPHVAILFTMDW